MVVVPMIVETSVKEKLLQGYSCVPCRGRSAILFNQWLYRRDGHLTNG